MNAGPSNATRRARASEERTDENRNGEIAPEAEAEAIHAAATASNVAGRKSQLRGADGKGGAARMTTARIDRAGDQLGSQTRVGLGHTRFYVGAWAATPESHCQRLDNTWRNEDSRLRWMR